ncbi:hypothetical protein B0J14DRAFT_704501 [Halenospora varia]|nr:hypothetical protein B0J14DRAFT_704501 [Halenospora varia]
MMSLSALRAASTIPLNSSSDVQQLAIFINSIVPFIELFSFIVDLSRFLAVARESLNSVNEQIEDSKSRGWFISKNLKDRLNEAISEHPPKDSINRELYEYDRTLRPVVIFHIMYAKASVQRSEAENTISRWPAVGRRLLAILLGKFELHEDISHILNKNYRQYMKAPKDTQPPAPKRMRIEPDTFLGVLLGVQAQAGTGREMVVARVKESKGHILQTLLSGFEQSQHNGEGEPQWGHIQTPLGLGAQAGPGGQEGALSPSREGQVSNLDTTITNAPGVLATSQQPPSQPQPQLPQQGQSSAQSLVPNPNAVLGSDKDLRRINLPLDSAPFCDSLRRIMSGKLSESFRCSLKKDQSDFFRNFMSEKLNIFLPPGPEPEPEPEPGAASRELPAIMCIRSELEFHFTKETTRHLMQSEFGPNAEYQQLHSLTWQNLFGYLERSLNRSTKLRATGMLKEGMVRIFIQKIEGSPFEVTMQFARKFFTAIVMNLEDTPQEQMGMILKGIVQS